jgi:phosphoadenosine phosphosulfate reductase
MKELVDEILNKIDGKNPVQQLAFLSEKFKGKIAFSTSFGQEDQIITHFIFENNLPVEIFTLDTGRMFGETYKTFSKTIQKYKKEIKVYFPDKEKVEKLMTEKGPYSFYESVDNRKECCNIRKVIPLNRALKGKDCWITGLRASQSQERQKLSLLEFDENYNLLKFNPLLNWNIEDVKDFIFKNNIPYNVLHDKGFISIGCEPCTRAVKPGEDIRAGRWWWEDNSKKECGLHEK